MSGDPRSVAEDGGGRAGRVRDEVDVGGAQRERFGVILHARAAFQIAEEHRGNSHEISAAPRGA
jgi:hypothetical protein